MLFLDEPTVGVDVADLEVAGSASLITSLAWLGGDVPLFLATALRACLGEEQDTFG